MTNRSALYASQALEHAREGLGKRSLTLLNESFLISPNTIASTLINDIAEGALAWVKNCAMTLIKRGDLFTLLGWQRLLPSDLMRGHPEVRLAIAWGLALAMRFDECLQLLQEIEPDIKAGQSARRMASEC
jgi:hypothetical protein